MTEEFVGFKTIKDLPEGDLRKSVQAKTKLVGDLTRYIQTHPNYDQMTKEEVVGVTIQVILNDIGAANDLLRVIGVDIDLYTYESEKDPDVLKIIITREQILAANMDPQGYIEDRLIAAGFSRVHPIKIQEFFGEETFVSGGWIYTQAKTKEVIDGDRTEGTSAGGDPSPDQWEDFVRWRRLRKDGDHPGILRTEGDT